MTDRRCENRVPRLSREAWTPCWENLNKLEWPHGFTFTSHGVHIGVRVDKPELLPMLRKRLPPGATRSQAKTVDRYFSVILGGKPEGWRTSAITASSMATTRNSPVRWMWTLILDAFETWVRLSVAELSPTHTFIHAGVVGWKGRAILVPGRSLSGKTSLVVELVKAGATYYSDEFAVLDSRGQVHPFLLQPSVRMNGPAERQSALPIEEIGGWGGSKPLPVGLVVLSEYAAGAKWRPRRLPAGLGALGLLTHTLSARHSPERALAVLERITAQAAVLKGRRGEAQAMARTLLATVKSQSETPVKRRRAGDGAHGAAPRLVAVNPTVPAERRLLGSAIAGTG